MVWNNFANISWLISLGCLLSADHNIVDLFQGYHAKVQYWNWNIGGIKFKVE